MSTGIFVIHQDKPKLQDSIKSHFASRRARKVIKKKIIDNLIPEQPAQTQPCRLARCPS